MTTTSNYDKHLQRYVSTHGFTVPKHFPGDMDKELYSARSRTIVRNLVHNQTIDKTKSIDTEEYTDAIMSLAQNLDIEPNSTVEGFEPLSSRVKQKHVRMSRAALEAYVRRKHYRLH
jgi:hypothetical protein